MSLLSITNLGGGESSLRLLPVFFRFFFTRELNKLKNGDTEIIFSVVIIQVGTLTFEFLKSKFLC